MADSQYEEQLKSANEAVYKHSVELARLKQELEQTNQQQESLIHFISHEVKGFLTKDMGSLAALDEGDFGQMTDSQHEFVKAALAESRGGVKSVLDLLKASNLKKGTMEYKKESFDLAAAVKEQIEKSRPMAEKKGLALSFAAEGDFNFVGDKVEMTDHVFRNIIENAINYTPSGKVDIALKKQDDKIIFTIADTGVGITDEDKKRLFTEGGHGKDSLKVNVHSTGYGLYIAKNIVVAHGGTIRAESEGPGKGSQFIIELPQ